MTRDEINRLIQDNGLFHGTVKIGVIMDINHLERFAALVAAAEREAIAQIIEDAPELVPSAKNDQGGCVICGFDPKFAASYIRARGEKT